MSTALEREIRARHELAVSAMLAMTPAGDYAKYLEVHARYKVLQELQDFITERNERLAAGEIKDDD